MSSFKTLFAWLGRAAVEPPRRHRDPDTLSLRDWADLPPHHPKR